MNDLLQFDPWRRFRVLSGITQCDETDHFDVFRDLQNLFYSWLIKGANPAGPKAKVSGHGQHISSCQSHIIPSVLSLPDVKPQDEDHGSFSHMRGFDEEEPGHFSDPLSRLRIGYNNEVPRLEIRSRRSPPSCLQDLEEKLLGNGFVLVEAYGPS